jgi:hypothetical protein
MSIVRLDLPPGKEKGMVQCWKESFFACAQCPPMQTGYTALSYDLYFISSMSLKAKEPGWYVLTES